MSCGLKKVCRTWLLPGAARKMATRTASTATVLTVEIAVARRPPPDSSFGPRPAAPKPAAGVPALTPPDGRPGGSWPPEPGPAVKLAMPAPGVHAHQGWIVGTVR